MVNGPQKFCSVPWKELYVDPQHRFGLCCKQTDFHMPKMNGCDQDFSQHWNGKFLAQIRQNFQNGEPLPACSHCWQEEDLGKISMRMRRNKRYLGIEDPAMSDPRVQALLESTDSEGTISTDPVAALISVGNDCQLRCISCNPSYSRGVAKDYQRLGWDLDYKSRMQINIDKRGAVDNLYTTLKHIAPTLEWLHVSGGEPTLSKDLLEFLEWCDHHGHAQHINLVVNTNGVNVKSEFVNALSGFSKVLLQISMDGVDELDDYLRWPGRWSKKIQFILDCQEKFPDMYLHSVIYSLNVSKLDRMLDFSHKHGITHTLECLHYPNFLAIEHTPTELKIKARQRILPYLSVANQTLKNSIQTVLNRLDLESDPAAWEKTIATIKNYDSIRPIKFIDANSDFIDYL